MFAIVCRGDPHNVMDQSRVEQKRLDILPLDFIMQGSSQHLGNDNACAAMLWVLMHVFGDFNLEIM